MLEEWRDVVGYEESHQVSNLGRIKLKNRVIIRDGEGSYKGRKCTIKERVLKPRLENNGYYRLNLRKVGSRKAHSVHKLVCTAFNGPSPSKNHQVDHINRIRTDNRPENLRWLTPKENIHHSIEQGGINVVGVNNPAAKLTEVQVLEICVLLDTTSMNQTTIAKRYKTVQSVISAINVGSNWNALTNRKAVSDEN